MAEFKLCIADPKTGKSFQKEVKDADAAPFMGLMLGDTVKGEVLGVTGAEFQITGGSDKAGFPMRRGIKGVRKKLNLLGGIGLRKHLADGVRKRKTVCGHKIIETISQINLKVTKEGAKKVSSVLGGDALEEAPKAEDKKE